MKKKSVKMTTEAQLAMVRKICERISAEEMTRIIELIVDCRNGNVMKVDRNKFRELLGLDPFAEKSPNLKVENVIVDADVIIVPATNREFVARKKFVPDIRSVALVKILLLNEHFRENYLEKIEGPSGKTRIRYVDVDDESEITLKELFFVLEMRGNRKPGIARVRDICDVLREVAFSWKTIGWVLNSYDLDSKQCPVNGLLSNK